MTLLPGPVVDADWLAVHLDHPDLVIADVRWRLGEGPGRADYAAGHIPGSVFVDLDTDLAGPASSDGGRHPLPDPDDFARTMGALGIGDHSTVVAYDDAGATIAARLWWMLDVLGVEAAVLDGGFDAWLGPLSADQPERAPARFTARPWPSDRVATADEVAAARPGTVVLDARSAERYDRGAAVDPRPGHVPGARSAPATGNLDDGRFLPPDRLAERYRRLGAGERPVVAYCGSGVTACTNLLALRRAGLPDGRLFVGSWSAWGADPARPAETGPDRG